MVDNNHSAIIADIREALTRIGALEDQVKELWNKYNGTQKMFLGILVSTCMTLTGIIVLLVTG